MQSRKETAWKKSRKFGDIHGGRVRRKIPDNIFMRMHSLKRPSEHDALPILIEDNPSKGFIFPFSGAEIVTLIYTFPDHIKDGLTHIWLRRVKKMDYLKGELPQACFICGSGVRVIILYAFPADLRMVFGKRKPKGNRLNQYQKYCDGLRKEANEWIFQWDLDSLKHYYLECLLTHELGHHLDWHQRHWSPANTKKIESFADDFAVVWGKHIQHVYGKKP